MKHKFCDMYFLKYIRLSFGQKFTTVKPDNWMYFYRRGDQTNSITFQTQGLDDAIDKPLCKIMKKWGLKKDVLLQILNHLELYAVKRMTFDIKEYIPFVTTNFQKSPIHFVEFCMKNQKCIKDIANSPHIHSLFNTPVYKGVIVFANELM